MAALFWAGRGTPRDYSKAYFWALVAQSGGDKDAGIFVASSAPHLSHAQVAAEQEQANKWLQAHGIAQSSPSLVQ
jgi:TPR repeat protein